MAADVVTLESADTGQGGPVTVTVDGSTVRINDANVLITDAEASNGVIHVVDSVLISADHSLSKGIELSTIDCGRRGE